MTNKEDYKKTHEPEYYKGKGYGYTAKEIIDDFHLGSWTGQAVQYILRAGKKEGNPTEQDIQKAINVLHFELDRLYNQKVQTRTGALSPTGTSK